MRKTVLFAPLACLAVSSFALAPSEEGLRPADIEALGKQISTYIEARDKNKGIDKARDAILEDLKRFEKRVKRDPLSLTADLGKAMWLSKGYERISVKKGKVVAIDMPSDGEKDKKEKPQYAVLAPEKYNPKQAYPLILCIPDKGEKTTDHLTEKWVSSAIRDGAILAAAPMPADPKMWLEMGGADKRGGGGICLNVMREVADQYAIDFDRIYLAGRGEGVAAAMVMAARFPHRFAGVIGRSGDAPDVAAENFASLPTFFAGAGANATAFAEKIDKLGYKNATLKADGSEDDVWTWIQAHPRVSNPPSVVLYPSQLLPLTAYWVEVPNAEYKSGESYIKVTADRASNTITIDAEGVQRATLYLNDLLVDLDKPVKLVSNGVETAKSIPRNLESFLNSFAIKKSDSGRPFVCTQQVDIPEKPKERKK